MITLSNLHEATIQEVFDQISIHLLTQNEQSFILNTDCDHEFKVCAYRGRNELKCAVGCIISDDEYNKDMEGASWFAISKSYAVLVDSEISLMIGVLQKIHDRDAPIYWKECLINTAIAYGLDYSHLNKFN